MKTLSAFVSVMILLVPVVTAQQRASAEPPEAFEVASVKPNVTGRIGVASQVDRSGRWTINNATLKLFIFRLWADLIGLARIGGKIGRAHV